MRSLLRGFWTTVWLVGPGLLFGAVPPQETYRSPELRPDHSFKLQMRAPKAQEVFVVGAWQPPGNPQALHRDATGLWSITVGPLPPSVYNYWFVVDGAVVTDEGNPFVRIRTNGTSVSMIEVPDSPPALWQTSDVAHGSVETSWLKSAAFAGQTRKVLVYLPPGYAPASQAQYPLLVLLHGSGETGSAWIDSGAANLILDNLIAAGRAQPMIVVIPFIGPVAPESAGLDAASYKGVHDYLLNEIIPWAEGRYPLAKGRNHRAIAGFSRGGIVTAALAFAHPDQFSEIGLFSVPTAGPFAYQVKPPADSNRLFRVFFLGVGDRDPIATNGCRDLDASMTRAGIKHVYRETAGAHEYPVWRYCLAEFAPLLFRDRSPGSSNETSAP